MTGSELEEAIARLIEEANVQTEEAKADYEAGVLRAEYGAAERRMYRSCALEQEIAELRAAYDTRILRIQKDLDESIAALRAEEEPSEGGSGGEDAHYHVDYRLSMRDRYIEVKEYYLSYDPAQALADLRQDQVAKDYLGSYYNYLLQLLTMIQV